MTVMIQGSQLRDVGLGRRVTKTITQSGAGTQNVFTITGEVLITSIYGKVTTAITVAGTTKLTANPTAGTSVDLCTATDLGTTDTVVGEIVVPIKGSSLALGANVATPSGTVVSAGVIEHTVATGGDGAIQWCVTYVPLSDDGAVAAA